MTHSKGKPVVPVPVTAARAQLFELVEALLAGRAARIELSHRGYDDRVVLLRKADLEGLEADLEALRVRLGPEPRPLRGMATLVAKPDAVLEATRARAAELAARKLASFGPTGEE